MTRGVRARVAMCHGFDMVDVGRRNGKRRGRLRDENGEDQRDALEYEPKRGSPA
jgi:hypothetical protein